MKYLKWSALLFGAVSLSSLAIFILAPQILSFATGIPEEHMKCDDKAIEEYNRCVGLYEAEDAPYRHLLIGCLKPLCPEVKKFAFALFLVSAVVALILFFASRAKSGSARP